MFEVATRSRSPIRCATALKFVLNELIDAPPPPFW